MSDPKDAKGIFLAALDIAEAAERAAFVERSCGGDAALRLRVEDLLRAYGQPSGPLDKLAAALAPTLPPAENAPVDPRRAETLTADRSHEDVGDVIAGRYKLREELGQGGMGAVFMAQQTQPVKRVVALKLIKLGMDSKQVLARFEAERQALALMDHPNIAKVLDAGTTDSGRPFFVMELVKGVPITRFCDERQLSPRERLELFIPVCNAIQHAHQKGIIHRDIKPTNVLVALYDDRPVPKVIDFGVAKAAGLQLTDASLMTSFGGIVGTPEYMSPEQAQLNQLDIDTRSDVYALGVLLYELLTGTTPIDRKRLGQGALFEVLRIIREEEPPWPSTRLSTSDALASIAATRATEPSKLAKLMRGELDWIVMKCLEKDRARRYETANGLAHDLGRYLADEPVEACPPSSMYRLRKFARKHRAPVIGLAAVAAALVIGIAGTTWGLFRATRAEKATAIALVQMTSERDAKEKAQGFAAGAMRTAQERLAQAEAERKRAETERDRAEQQLANGLLRPIGFSPQGIETAELRSFVDWSAIKESPLKMRVLEIAFENPETALRVARRAERVFQACIGLSSNRRAKAIQLLSAKQRDLAADPRIRVAACWLALGLGSSDLPAWAESCSYLSESKNKSLDRFGEFLGFATDRSDPHHSAQLDLDPLIAILETSTNDEVQGSLCGVLPSLAPRLRPAQVRRAADALTAMLERSNYTNVHEAFNSGLTALAPRLEPAQAERAWDAFIANFRVWSGPTDVQIKGLLEALAVRLEPAELKRACNALPAILEKSRDPYKMHVAHYQLMALAPRLEPSELKGLADALIRTLENSTNDYALGAAANGLIALAARLEAADLKRAASALIRTLKDRTKADVLRVASDGLIAIAPRLEPAELKSASDALIGLIEKSTDDSALLAVSNGLELASRLEPAEAAHAWGALIAMLEKHHDEEGMLAAQTRAALVALALRMEPGQVKLAGDSLIAMLEKLTKGKAIFWEGDVLAALAPRLKAAQIARAANILMGTLEKTTDAEVLRLAKTGLEALAPSLNSAGVQSILNSLIALEEKSTNRDVLDAVTFALNSLAPRLEPAQLELAANALVASLEKSTDTQVVWKIIGLKTLAARLKPAQAKLVADALIVILQKRTDDNVLFEANGALALLAARLEPAQTKRAADALILALQNPLDNSVRWEAIAGLAALAPRLEPPQVMRAWATLIAGLEKLTTGAIDDLGWSALVALAPRLDPAARDNLSTTATADILDFCSSCNFIYVAPAGKAIPMTHSIVLARSIRSPRSLAKLLSHPACVANQRETLLNRFEELVFHDGKPVFLKPEATDGKKPASDPPPPRRFHSLHDAAAWIQQNWPDFDLEASYPATWRGSR